ncbi:hypothetical protein Q6348_01600 [Isoptericola sp. b441]|uniref:Uncharacterized protein n=1 Tax=Actinotalea lenta TaxID=3064654 RepID=A0ABT9D568_9CELL|nr:MULTISPECIES: hypothetical protein [unclassified Isoptericola]MDO8105886.1 hypothetical protein [Isoptericola sp. b441]MDO8122602.1 hypothetical protein [Isoptericola sp. b490]
MSTQHPSDDAAQQDEPGTAAGGPQSAEGAPGDVPDLAELERIATPVTVRRVPRYRAFIVTGVVVGLVATLVLAILTADRPTPGAGWAIAAVGLGLASIGALLGGLVAVAVEAVLRRR